MAASLEVHFSRIHYLCASPLPGLNVYDLSETHVVIVALSICSHVQVPEARPKNNSKYAGCKNKVMPGAKTMSHLCSLCLCVEGAHDKDQKESANDHHEGRTWTPVVKLERHRAEGSKEEG